MMSVVRWLFPFAQGLGFGVIAMLLHEAGHLLAALILGLQIRNVGMKWSKGLYTVREKGTPLQNLLVSAAGPLINMFFFAVVPGIPALRLANFCYALVNMLPIQGADGYRIAMCWQQLRSDKRSEKGI